MKRADVLAIVAAHGIAPSKKFGQNFLVDPGTAGKIVSAVAPGSGDHILEIGPGLGALTGPLLDAGAAVTAVEIDAGICRYLAGRFAGTERFTLVAGDILKTPLPDRFTAVVSNLPYYLASEILFSVADRFSAPRVHVMVQKEMGERITAGPGGKEYGALTVSLGLRYRAATLFTVPPNVFYPRPDVASVCIALRRREPLLAGEALAWFGLLVKSAFWGRRKTLLAALSSSPHLSLGRPGAGELLAAAGIPGSRRGEELSLDEFAALARVAAAMPGITEG